MSYLAIGATTRAIALLLERKLNKPPLLGAITPRVTTLPLDDERVDDDDGVNLFLYRIAESAYARNMEWRGDRSRPAATRRPPLAVTLSYLVTAYAQPAPGNGTGHEDITAHQLMGNAMAILHEYPVLNDVHDADFDADDDVQFARELRDSFEKVKVTLMPQSMDEFSKIWTGFNKGYRLSVGYEVSLVQIAPVVPSAPRAPVAQELRVLVDTLDAPAVASIDPARGPAGEEVRLTGSNLTARGSGTSVIVDDIEIGPAELTSVGSNQIVFNIPAALQRGPQVRVSVYTGGRESEPVFYEVAPWIRSLQPLRGSTGIPVTIPFEVPPGATVSVEIDGLAAATTVDAPDKLVRATVPAAIATNGPKPVVLILNDGTPRRSNARLFEVLPAIQAVNVVTQPTPARTTITVTGQRLGGADVSVRYGKLLISRGDNPSPTGVIVEVARVLPADLPVSVLVGSRESNPLPPLLERIEPPEAFAGDEVSLVGRGLSGPNVSVRFGATNVTVGAHPYASRLSATVPSTLAPGASTVRATVNGNDTNTLPFRVLG